MDIRQTAQVGYQLVCQFFFNSDSLYLSIILHEEGVELL
jgi:hypothetical protein